MKLLILGLCPILIFWFVEDKFGTSWGLIAAIVWAVGECIYELIRYKRVQKLTLFSSLLVVVLGGLGLWLDNSILFKFQPVTLEVVFAAILFLGGRSGEPLMLKMARETKPQMFENQNPILLAKQKTLMTQMTRHLIILLILHSGLLGYLALRGTTGQWAFWKGIGFNLFLLIWVGIEFAMIKFLKAPRS